MNPPANNQQWQAQRPRRNNHQQQPSDKNLRCQLCDRVGHSAKVCRSQSHNHLQARANFAARFPCQQSPWIIDSGATHHIASDTQSLATVHDYHGTKEITMGNGNIIPISHNGNANISASNHHFKLLNTLCSSVIKNNLISVSKFRRDNHSSIEFFPFHYLVKDLRTGASLVWGQNKDGQNKTSSICNSCYSNKMHKLTISKNSLRSNKPLQILYSDLWGPSPVLSIDKKRYYVLFVDQFSKYMWLFTLK